MKKQVLTFVLLLIGASLFAQSNKEQEHNARKTSTVTTTVIESTNNPWYVGLSAGYLFKNNELHDNPMWYLGNGQFYELNVGLRGKIFGWSASLGYLTMDRDV